MVFDHSSYFFDQYKQVLKTRNSNHHEDRDIKLLNVAASNRHLILNIDEFENFDIFVFCGLD